jgi:hypothetical protein
MYPITGLATALGASHHTMAPEVEAVAATDVGAVGIPDGMTGALAAEACPIPVLLRVAKVKV